MKYKMMIAAALMASTAAPAFAQDEAEGPITLSGSVSLVSDYRFRGVSQTDEHIAIQGGVTVSHASGLYVGTWASNLSGWGTFGGSNTELDLFAGYKADLGGVTIDAGLTWYMYPGGADNTDFAEPYIKVSTTAGPVSLLAGVAYAPKQEALGRWYFTAADYAAGVPNAPGDKEDNLYIWGDVSAGIPDTPITLKGHLGYSNGNSGLGPNGTSVAPTGKYLDWLIGADVAIPGTPVTVGVAYVDTNISNRERAYLVAPGVGFQNFSDGGNIAGSKVVASITAAF